MGDEEKKKGRIRRRMIEEKGKDKILKERGCRVTEKNEGEEKKKRKGEG